MFNYLWTLIFDELEQWIKEEFLIFDAIGAGEFNDIVENADTPLVIWPGSISSEKANDVRNEIV